MVSQISDIKMKFFKLYYNKWISIKTQILILTK